MYKSRAFPGEEDRHIIKQLQIHKLYVQQIKCLTCSNAEENKTATNHYFCFQRVKYLYVCKTASEETGVQNSIHDNSVKWAFCSSNHNHTMAQRSGTANSSTRGVA